MNNLKIHSVNGKGNLSTECVWINVKANITDLSAYLLCDTTFLNGNRASNELRHVYWFPKQTVNKGDLLRLMTKEGTNAAAINDRGTMTHTFYWQLGRTVWNKDRDTVLLFQLSTWETTPA